ncbi:MAG TPA: hypothetical protein VGJ74_18475 [Burkholderiales bacterium]|jgi:hypothetical protein
MFNRRIPLIVASSMLLALPLAVRAQSETQLVDKYKTLAGSDANAKSLVTGLRDGKEVTLTDGKTTTAFTPPTGKMGGGNVDIALALADESLKQKGITNPTPDQLKTALSGILQQRADGKGWGQIANAMGFKLGDVMRSEKADKVAHDRQAREARGDRADRAARPERPERPEKPERAGR